MKDEVHAGNVLVLLFLADHVGKVGAHVEGRIDGDLFVAAILQVVNKGCNDRNAGNDVTGVFIHIFPSGHLVEFAGVIETGKLGVFLQCQHGDRKHDHRMAVTRQSANCVKYVLRNNLTDFPLGNNFGNLSISRNVTCKKHVPEGLNGRICRTGSLWQRSKSLGNGLATEADALLWIQVGDIGYERTDITGTTDALIDSYLVDNDLTKFFDKLCGTWAVFIDLQLERVFQGHCFTLLFVVWGCTRIKSFFGFLTSDPSALTGRNWTL